MADFNPNHPERIGEEYIAELNRSWTVGSTAGAQNAVTQKWRSTAADPDMNIATFASAVTGSGYMMAEVVEDGDEALANATDHKIQPATALRQFNYKTNLGVTTLAGLIAAIDETSEPSTTDNIQPVVVGWAQYIDIQVNSSQITAACAGKRVLGVTLGLRAMPHNVADKTDVYQVRVVDAATGEITYRNLDKVVGSNRENWFNLGELHTDDEDPDNAVPWSEETLLKLATGGDLAFRVASGGGDGVKFSRFRLAIATCDENRLGAAIFNHQSWELTTAQVGDGLGVWSETKPLLDPNNSALVFSKADDTTYRTIYRRAWTGDRANGLNVTLPVVSRHDSAEPPADTYLDDPLVVQAASFIGPSGLGPYTVIASIPTLPRAPVGGANEPIGLLPVRLSTVSGSAPGTDLADGQTYSQLVAAVVDADSGPLEQYVSTFADGSNDYTALRFALGLESGTTFPTAPLTVTVMDAAGVTTLGTGSLTEAAFRVGPNYTGGGILLQTTLEVEATLAASTQYRIVIDSASEEGRGWIVGVLSSRGGEGVSADDSLWPTGIATYGGTTDYAFTHPDVATVDCDDLGGYLSLAIAGPTGLAVEADAYAFDGADPCGIESIPYALLEWDASALGADFLTYHLQRRDSVSVEWEDVAYVTLESVETFSDVEARLVVESEWRIRAEGPTGQVSLWDGPEAATLPTVGCGYTFSTNWSPVDAVAYKDVYDSRAVRGYAFPDADEALVRTFAGRDEFVLFRPTERRSVRFSRDLLVRAFNGPAGMIGPPAFDALRELVRQAVPYIAVRDEQGNRWYAGVIVREGAVRMPARHHSCTVEVVPVSTIATPPTIEG